MKCEFWFSQVLFLNRFSALEGFSAIWAGLDVEWLTDWLTDWLTVAKSEFCRQIFVKPSQPKISRKSLQWVQNSSMQTDRQTCSRLIVPFRILAQWQKRRQSSSSAYNSPSHDTFVYCSENAKKSCAQRGAYSLTLVIHATHSKLV